MIRIIPIILFLLFTSGISAESVALFDGKSLDGRRNEMKDAWRVEDGSIVGGNRKKVMTSFNYIVAKSEFDNFDLRLKFKLEGTQYLNTGIYFRSRVTSPGQIVGYQADIGDTFFGGIYEQGRGRG